MFMTENIEDQKTWINAKMNLARASTNKETRRREEEILDRIIPTGIMDLDEEFDEEEMDNLSECRTYDLTEDQEEDLASMEPDKFFDEDQEEENIQPLKSLKTSYQDHKRQDKETVHPLSSTTELDDQLERAEYFTELDVHWGYDNEHIRDKDKWEMTETNQGLFEPSVIFSSPYSPMTSQTKTDELFQDQKNEQQNIVNRNYDIQMKEQDTKNTQCVLQRSGDNDLFPDPEECTSWVTKTEHKELLNSGNRQQLNQMKVDGIDWPISATRKEVKSFLGLENINKGFIQDSRTLTEPLKELLETDETFLVKKGKQNNKDMITLPEDLFPNSL